MPLLKADSGVEEIPGAGGKNGSARLQLPYSPLVVSLKALLESGG